MNHQPASLYGESNIQMMGKTCRIRRAGPVTRMLDNNPAKLVFSTDLVGTIIQGTQWARWVDYIECDLVSIGRDREYDSRKLSIVA